MKSKLLKTLALIALCVAMLSTVFACAWGEMDGSYDYGSAASSDSAIQSPEDSSSTPDSSTLPDSSSQQQISSSSAPDSSTEPQPEPTKYNVYYVAGDGAIGTIPSAQKEEGESFNLPDGAELSKDGFTLGRWNDGAADYDLGASYVMPAHDVTFTAVWNQNDVYFTVTFDLNNGEADLTEQVADGQKVSRPEQDPVNGEAIFMGWKDENGNDFDFNASITADTTVSAFYQYKVEIDLDGGKYIGTELGSKEEYYDVGSIFILPTANDFEKTGYKFVSWKIGENTYAPGNGFSDKNESITAVWEIKSYTVTFDTKGGDKILSQTVTHGQTAEAPQDPQHTAGYFFSHWTLNGAKYDFSKEVTSDITLKAYYVWNVSFDLGGATGSIDSTTYAVGESFAVPGIGNITYEGHKFGGWSDSICNGTHKEGDSITGGNHNLTAIWEHLYTVTFYLNSGEGPCETPKKYYEKGETLDLSTIIPTRTDYVFLGWLTNGNIVTEITFGDSYPFEIDLTAEWGNIKVDELKGVWVDTKKNIVEIVYYEAPVDGYYGTATVNGVTYNLTYNADVYEGEDRICYFYEFANNLAYHDVINKETVYYTSTTYQDIIDGILNDVKLPTQTMEGFRLAQTPNADSIAVEWKSSNENVISISGNTANVNLPSVDTDVTLTATITCNGTKGQDTDYTVKVLCPGWRIVTDADTLKAGDRVVIVAANEAVAMGSDRGNNRNQVAVTKNGELVTINPDVQMLTLEDGKVIGTFAFNTGSGYLYAAGGDSNNHLKTEDIFDDNGSFIITVEEGIATIKAQGSSSKNWIRYNATSDLFSCYGANNQMQNIVIYKYLGGTPDADIVAATAKNLTVEMNSYEGFTLPSTADECELAWAIKGETTAITLDGYNVTLNRTEEEQPVVLEATVSFNGKKATKEFNFTVAAEIREVTITEALELEDGTQIKVSGIVNLIDYAWSNGSMSVYITDGTNDLYIYKLSTEVKLNDVITVTGTMDTYNGRQIGEGATAVINSANNGHSDDDNNHNCDLCGNKLSECKDENPVDEKCDICGNDMPTGGGEGGETTTLDLTAANFDSFSTWNSTYSEKTVNAIDDLGSSLNATINFSRANKQSGTITDRPVTVGTNKTPAYVTVTLNDKSFNSITFNLKRWSTSKYFSSIAIEYYDSSINEWVSSGSSLTLSSNGSLPNDTESLTYTNKLTGITQVRLVITGKSTSNSQIGLTSIEITAQ